MTNTPKDLGVVESLVEAMARAICDGEDDRYCDGAPWAERSDYDRIGYREDAKNALSALCSKLEFASAEEMVEKRVGYLQRRAAIAGFAEEVRQAKAAGMETRPYGDWRAEQEIVMLREQLQSLRSEADSLRLENAKIRESAGLFESEVQKAYDALHAEKDSLRLALLKIAEYQASPDRPAGADPHVDIAAI